jgi:hypothetical protein
LDLESPPIARTCRSSHQPGPSGLRPGGGQPAALDTLGRLDLLRRKIDEADRRSLLVQRTVQGSVFLREFGDLAAEAAKGV